MINLVDYLNAGSINTPNTTTKENNTDNTLGKDDFMNLLIAQISNQNPMEPMKDTDFIAQLAQFSSLEQMQNIASGMEMLALSQAASTNSQMVNLIGKRAVIEGNDFTIKDNDNIRLRYDITDDEDTKNLKLIIRDSNNDIVKTVDLNDAKVGENLFEFDCTDENGNKLTNGNYHYEIVNSSNEKPSSLKTYSNLLIDAVKFDGSTIILRSGTNELSIDNIIEVIQG